MVVQTLHTTARTLIVASKALPLAVKATQHSDGLFRRPSGVIVDLGGDPGEWTVSTPRLLHHNADHDVTGWRTQKGGSSAAHFMGMGSHRGASVMTLAAFIEKKHPLNDKGISLEATQAAYEVYRNTVDAA